MKYYLRISLAIAFFALWSFADFGVPCQDAAAQGGGGGQGGGRNRGRGGRGQFQANEAGGGEQATQPTDGGRGAGGGLFGGRGGRGRGGRGNRATEGETGTETTEQSQFTRGGGRNGTQTITPGQPAADPKEMARQLFERLDQNHDNMLQANEQGGLRGVGGQADTNRDGVITLDELEASFANAGAQFGGPARGRGPRGGEERQPSEQATDGSQEERGGRRGRGRGRGGENGENNGEENNGQRGERPSGEGQTQRNREGGTQTKANSDKKDPQLAKTLMSTMAEKSYRFKPAKDQLPKEVASWFTAMLSKDANRDGQVDMSEYSRPSEWTEAKLREFNQRDKNGDGLITPEEAMAGK